MPRVESLKARQAQLGDEQALLTSGLAALRDLLPADWTVQPAATPDGPLGGGAGLLITIGEPLGGFGRVVVEAKQSFAPRDAQTLLGGQLRLLRRLDPYATVLVLAPWLSPRTRALLREQKVGYLDLTGNVSLELDRPAVVIRTAGAERDPSPTPREKVSLRGVRAGRVVRLLADVRPPYTTSAIAQGAGVSVAHVSRVLATLDREALIQRGQRALVVDVDWPNLLRRRSETYRLYAANQAQGYISPTGSHDLARRLPEEPHLYRAVTGSFGASQRAPVAAPGQLTLYVIDPQATAAALGLLPADTGADTVLLQAYDFVVLDRAAMVDGLRVVAPTQLVLDCLSGSGRMPAEGEALLDWMTGREAEWRLPSITALPPRGQVAP